MSSGINTEQAIIQKRAIIVTQIINELGITIETNTKRLIHCKECKYSDESLVEGCVYCNETDRAMDENGFCHKGEREGE